MDVNLNGPIQSALVNLAPQERPTTDDVVNALRLDPDPDTTAEARTRLRFLDTYTDRGNDGGRAVSQGPAVRAPSPFVTDAYDDWAGACRARTECVLRLERVVGLLGAAGPSVANRAVRSRARKALGTQFFIDPTLNDDAFAGGIGVAIWEGLRLSAFYRDRPVFLHAVWMLLNDTTDPHGAEDVMDTILSDARSSVFTHQIQVALRKLAQRVGHRIGTDGTLGAALLGEAKSLVRKLTCLPPEAFCELVHLRIALRRAGVDMSVAPGDQQRPWQIEVELAETRGATDRLCVDAMIQGHVVFEGDAPMSAATLHAQGVEHTSTLALLLTHNQPHDMQEMVALDLQHLFLQIELEPESVLAKILALVREQLTLVRRVDAVPSDFPDLRRYLKRTSDQLVRRLARLGMGVSQQAERGSNEGPTPEELLEGLQDPSDLPLAGTGSPYARTLELQLHGDPELLVAWKDANVDIGIADWWLQPTRYSSVGELWRVASADTTFRVSGEAARWAASKVVELARSGPGLETPRELFERVARQLEYVVAAEPLPDPVEMEWLRFRFGAFGFRLDSEWTEAGNVTGGYAWELSLQDHPIRYRYHLPPSWYAVCQRAFRDDAFARAFGDSRSVKELVANFFTRVSSTRVLSGILEETFDPETQLAMKHFELLFNPKHGTPTGAFSAEYPRITSALTGIADEVAGFRRRGVSLAAGRAEDSLERTVALLGRLGLEVDRANRWTLREATADGKPYRQLMDRLFTIEHLRMAYEQTAPGHDIVTWFRNTRGDMSGYFLVGLLPRGINRAPAWLRVL